MRKTIIALFLGMTILFSGCAAFSPLLLISPAVEGYIMWKDGEGVRYYNREGYEVYQALKIVLHNLSQKVTQDDIKAQGNFYLVSKSSKHSFKINVVGADTGVTALKIRIDFMGDKPYAELIYKNLDVQLGIKALPQ